MVSNELMVAKASEKDTLLLVESMIYISLTFSSFKSHLQMPVLLSFIPDTCTYKERKCS